MLSAAPADAILVLDVGNTRLGLGIWDADGLHDTQRCDLHAEDELQAALETAWRATTGDRKSVALATVNPGAAARVQALAEEVTGLSVARVRDDLPLPMPIDVENPLEIGVDRICAAAAAFERLKSACAVASFGTAVTVDCVSSDGHFLGGAILPGYQMACDALHEGTAQLPRVEPRTPGHVFGRNTHDAIINGVSFGLAGGLREIVERYATELGEWPALVLTGGNAPLIADLVDFADAIVPDLCLMGVALTYRRAAGQS